MTTTSPRCGARNRYVTFSTRTRSPAFKVGRMLLDVTRTGWTVKHAASAQTARSRRGHGRLAARMTPRENRRPDRRRLVVSTRRHPCRVDARTARHVDAGFGLAQPNGLDSDPARSKCRYPGSAEQSQAEHPEPVDRPSASPTALHAGAQHDDQDLSQQRTYSVSRAGSIPPGRSGTPGCNSAPCSGIPGALGIPLVRLTT